MSESNLTPVEMTNGATMYVGRLTGGRLEQVISSAGLSPVVRTPTYVALMARHADGSYMWGAREITDATIDTIDATWDSEDCARLVAEGVKANADLLAIEGSDPEAQDPGN